MSNLPSPPNPSPAGRGELTEEFPSPLTPLPLGEGNLVSRFATV